MNINNWQEQKLSLLEQFHKLTIEQINLLESGEYDQMLSLFEKKDLLIKTIDELDKRHEINKNPEEILAKLQAIQKANLNLEEKLQNTKTAIGLKLLELQQSKKTEDKYYHYTQTEGAFIDKKQ
ncbi:MAG: hypothetical protein ACOX1Y_02870 [Zhaonellaceae bacterium]|jgi:hypothetical protein|nr:hypothetical protein [Clostridia bacterium]